MNSAVWGPLFWHVLESLAFHAPDFTIVQDLVATLPFLLPCRYCRASLARILKQDHKNLARAKNGPELIYILHSLVNQTLKKPNLSFSVYSMRLAAFQAPLSLDELNQFLAILVDNYDHNPDPNQERAWRAFWGLLPKALATYRPELALALENCPLSPAPLSSDSLRRDIACPNGILRQIRVMRGGGGL